MCFIIIFPHSFIHVNKAFSSASFKRKIMTLKWKGRSERWMQAWLNYKSEWKARQQVSEEVKGLLCDLWTLRKFWVSETGQSAAQMSLSKGICIFVRARSRSLIFHYTKFLITTSTCISFAYVQDVMEKLRNTLWRNLLFCHKNRKILHEKLHYINWRLHIRSHMYLLAVEMTQIICRFVPCVSPCLLSNSD